MDAGIFSLFFFFLDVLYRGFIDFELTTAV